MWRLFFSVDNGKICIDVPISELESKGVDYYAKLLKKKYNSKNIEFIEVTAGPS